MKEILFGKTLKQLQDVSVEIGLPKIHSKNKIADWLI